VCVGCILLKSETGQWPIHLKMKNKYVEGNIRGLSWSTTYHLNGGTAENHKNLQLGHPETRTVYLTKISQPARYAVSNLNVHGGPEESHGVMLSSEAVGQCRCAIICVTIGPATKRDGAAWEPIAADTRRYRLVVSKRALYTYAALAQRWTGNAREDPARISTRLSSIVTLTYVKCPRPPRWLKVDESTDSRYRKRSLRVPLSMVDKWLSRTISLGDTVDRNIKLTTSLAVSSCIMGDALLSGPQYAFVALR
jgi:hypothetical protein